MSKELDELKDLTRALRRRVSISDSSDWTAGSAPAMPASAAPSCPTKPLSLAEVAEKVKACRACPLGSSRIQAVPGVGNPQAKVLFVGEGPGFDEDHKGEPFVGRSGQLLDKIMAAIGLRARPCTSPTS